MANLDPAEYRKQAYRAEFMKERLKSSTLVIQQKIIDLYNAYEDRTSTQEHSQLILTHILVLQNELLLRKEK